MESVWFVAALWLALALIATLVSIWFRIATALSEIVVGTVAQLIIGALIGTQALGVTAEWITFLAGTGAIVLTFLAGAELDPTIFATKWKEALVVGLVGFFGHSLEHPPSRDTSCIGPYVRAGWAGLRCRQHRSQLYTR